MSLTVSNPPFLSITPRSGGMSTKHVSFSVLDNKNSGTLVADFGHHLLEALGMRKCWIKESPILSVFQQEVAIQKQNCSIIQTTAVILNIRCITLIYYKINTQKRSKSWMLEYWKAKNLKGIQPIILTFQHILSLVLDHCYLLYLEVRWSWNNRSWIIFICFIIISCIKYIIKYIFLHLSNFRMTVKPSLDSALIFLFSTVSSGVYIIITAWFNDFLWFLSRENKISDDAERPVKKVVITFVLPSTSSIPVLKTVLNILIKSSAST